MAQGRKTKKEIKSNYNPIVPAVDQASKVLLCLAKNPDKKMTLTQICTEVNIHKSKGFSILKTLEKYGFVRKDPLTKTYSLGLGLAYLGRKALDNVDYRELMSPFLERLVEETGQTALFGIISGENLFIVAKQESMEKIGVNIRLGHRFHITSGAHGKAIVSFMNDDEREKLLIRERLFFYGRPENYKRNILEREIEECRRLGFARDIGQLQPGINAVSSPVFGPGEKIIGCLILIGTFPESRIEEFGKKLVAVAREASLAIGEGRGSEKI